MGKHKISVIFATVGFSIGTALCAAWFYVDTHDVFTKRVYWSSPNGQASGFYTPAYDNFQTLTFALCPASVILIASMNFSDSRSTRIFNVVPWVIASFLNGLLYFVIGFRLPIVGIAGTQIASNAYQIDVWS